MSVFSIILISSLLFCLISCVLWISKLIKVDKDFTVHKGSASEGVLYSNTIAMLPQHKESATLHIPTYIGGIIYHIGSFSAIVLVFLHLIFPHFLLPANIWDVYSIIRLIFGGGLLISFCCGMALLVKKFVKKDLKTLSNIDDYLSNFLVDIFHLFTAIAMLFPCLSWAKPTLFVVASILFVYIPFGKLRHFLYYFAARYHLGIFFGLRGVWSFKKKKND